MTTTKKLNLLVEGWIEIGHSYAIVNCFQLIHLYKNYGDQINFYISEKEYFRKEWNDKRKLIYTKEYNELITNKSIFKVYDPKKDNIDVIYRITYPYDITINETNQTIPICVFYTSEFTKFDPSYFKVGCPSNITLDETYIKTYLNIFKNISFTSPSLWSSYGMESYLGDGSNRNKIISHGIDTTLFYKESSENSRKLVRERYNIKDTDVLLLNIGAMTKNKGIMYILQIMHILVNKLNKNHFKLLLKGTSDLYQTKLFLESYFNELLNANVMSKDEMNYLLENNIIFTEDTLSFKQIRLLYNASDLYISPYIAEGFNLCCLESLACGLPVLVPSTGSTKEYINDIYNNNGESFIYYINSKVVNINPDSELKVNEIDGNHLLNIILQYDADNKNLDRANNYNKMRQYIESNYSWNQISNQLYTHLIDISIKK